MNGEPFVLEEAEKEILRARAFMYVAGKYFSGLGARPEAFLDIEFRRELPAVLAVIENTRNLIDWDSYLAAFSQITRKGWTRPERGIHTIEIDDIFESDLDHLIMAACLVAKVYDPHKKGLTDENRMMRTKAILMMLLHETDELIAGDLTPHDESYTEAKASAIHPAKRLLVERYGADIRLVNIWEEFNAGETDLARDVEMLDHESAVRKGLRYDFEFRPRKGPVLGGEFARYYGGKHTNDWFRQRITGLMSYYGGFARHNIPSAVSSLTMRMRQMWEETRQWGEAVEQNVPGAITLLSQNILDRFSCILPE